MPPRPALKLKRDSRPISAIYLGNGNNNPASAASSSSSAHSRHSSIASSTNTLIGLGTPPDLPDLPNIPSPSSSPSSSHRDDDRPNGNGLPSPPATNSTGSGSTGDPGSVAVRVKNEALEPAAPAQQMLSPSNESNNSAGSGSASAPAPPPFTPPSRNSSRSSSRVAFVEEDDESHSEGEGDDTARLNFHRRPSAGSQVSPSPASDNVQALQRLKSLKERNRMTLEKLSSISRLSTPSPKPHSSRLSPHLHAPSSSSSASTRRSPVPSSSTSTSSGGSRLRPRERERDAPAESPLQEGRSGSETERESVTSSSAFHQAQGGQSGRYASPRRAANDTATLHSRSQSTYTPDSRRKRASMVSSERSDDEEEEGEGEGTWTREGARTSNSTYRERESTYTPHRDQGSLRQGGSGGRGAGAGASGRKRAALPREFFTSPGAGAERYGESNTSAPVTPHRQSTATTTANTSATMGLGRSKTMREGRWRSDDMSSTASTSNGGVQRERTTSAGDTGFTRQRRISIEAPLSARERERERRISAGARVGGVAETPGRMERRQSLRAGGSTDSGMAMWGSGGGGGVAGLGLGLGLGSGRSLVGEGLRAAGLGVRKSPGLGLDGALQQQNQQQHPQQQHPPRAATSMADYRYVEEEHANAPSARAGSRMARYSSPVPERDRDRFSSPFGSRRYSALPSTAAAASSSTHHLPHNHHHHHQQQQQTEHTRLMLESLGMFESQLNRIPGPRNVGSSGETTQAELARNAESIVFAAERLNAMLRAGVAAALDAQVEAEVDGGQEQEGVVEVWRRVGMEYREGLRASDELVRGVTGFLLGVGRVVREFSPVGGSEMGSPAMHTRSVSLGTGLGNGGAVEEDVRRSPDVGSSGSGRRSVEPRRSWEPPAAAVKGREREREDTLKRLGGDRPISIVGMRSSPSYQPRELDPPLLSHHHQRSPSRAKNTTGDAAPVSMRRRLFTPREQREQRMDAESRAAASAASVLDSPESTHSYHHVEPSPTPGSGTTTHLNRSRTLPPLAIPKPLPTLPSESLLRRHATTTDKSPGTNRRKANAANSISTRGSPAFPSITTPSNATTALTPHTVSNSPQHTPFPLLRNDSSKSGTGKVTFSRPSTVSVSALSGLQQQDQMRNRSGSISNAGNVDQPPMSAPPSAITTPGGYGSETERDAKRVVGSMKAARMSLDNLDSDGGATAGNSRASTVHPADRSALSTVLPLISPGGAAAGGAKRERRRTVTDIWPGHQ